MASPAKDHAQDCIHPIYVDVGEGWECAYCESFIPRQVHRVACRGCGVETREGVGLNGAGYCACCLGGS